MAMSGYFTVEGQPSPTQPGVHSPPTLSDQDQDSLSKQPLELSPGKTYDAIKDKTDGRSISIFYHHSNFFLGISVQGGKVHEVNPM